jgi:hypothetical protein
MLTNTSFSVANYKHCPKAQAFFTTKSSSKIRLLLRSSLSHVPLQLLGQVVGTTECSSNQPNLWLTEFFTPIFTRVQTSCFLNVPKNHTIMLPKLPSSPESDIWIFSSTIQLCGHLSYSAHHRHSHSTLLKISRSSLTCYNLSTANFILEPKITPHRLSISSFRLLPPKVS